MFRLSCPIFSVLALTACQTSNFTDSRDLQECQVSSDASGIISEAVIEGDELILSVGYSGGCEEHAFRLCWDGDFSEPDAESDSSRPAQVDIVLEHQDNGDSCEMWFVDHLRFDLSALRDAAGGEMTELLIQVGENNLEYSF